MKLYQIEIKTVNEVEVFYQSQAKDKVNASTSAYDMIKGLFKKDMQRKEMFVAVYMNKANMVANIEVLSSGGTSSTVVDVKLIAQGAILSNASAVIIAHNHPSGNLSPSRSDIVLTEKTKAALELFDIQLLDHLILSNNGYASLADEGDM